MSFKVVIPARYASTRLPGKPLLDIAGRPMIQWVIQRALQSGADEVLVATDDERIAKAAVHPHTQQSLAVMTRADHASGTDRIAEVARVRGWKADVIVVNVQGDEPQLPPALIDQTAGLLVADPGADIGTLCTPIEHVADFLDPNLVKVTMNAAGFALYFSRAPIPWHRDHAPVGLLSQTNTQGAFRHLGIYAYRVAALQRLTAMEPAQLEQIEKLEQLRALAAGMRIRVAVAANGSPPGIDTLADLERARVQLAAAQR